MDRNSIIGLVLIGAILIGYSFWMSPSEEEIAASKERNRQDSIAAAQMVQSEEKAERMAATVDSSEISTPSDSSTLAKQDSLKNLRNLMRFGELLEAAEGEAQFHTIENEDVRFTLSTKGGAPVQGELINYVTYDSLPLYVFDNETSQFAFHFWLDKNTEINTADLYWEPVKDEMSSNSAAYRLYKTNRQEYIQLSYSLNEDHSHIIDAEVSVVGFDGMLREMNDNLELSWDIHAPTHEKSREQEQEKTTVFFKIDDEDVDYIAERNYEEIEFETSIEWVSFKQQYFSTALISKTGFDENGAMAETIETNDQKYLKRMRTTLGMELQGASNPSFAFQFYVGPNHYQTLSDLDIALEDQIDLGWPIISWVNTLIVIPVFNFLDQNTGLSYGIIILLLTLFIKTLLFPITWKNYLSSARMRVLKPEVEELNKKFEGKDPMQKQQAVMGLYRQAGVNPMAGCLPALLQMPILYALFRFFPASIELRQESFLWADDLSSYDSILDLPFSIPAYGDHISLFTLLMAISTFLYTKYNMNMSAGGMGGAQEAQMKIITYFMPVMLLVFFNNYAAGLSYYYFTSNIISVGQQFAIKKYFINEDKIHAKIQENKRKPAKKSKFQERLEKMAKDRGYQPPKK